MLKKPIDVKEGTPIALVVQEDVLTPPAEMGMDIDADGKLFVVYKGADDAIYLAVSNPERKDWISHERIFYVPSGASRPNIALSHGKPLVVAELVPAGTEQKELWLYEPPYLGAGFRKITDGQYHLLAKDAYGEIYLFFQAPDGLRLLYRKESDGFALEEAILQEDLTEPYPVGFWVVTDRQTGYFEHRHILFINEPGGELPHYLMTAYEVPLPLKETGVLKTGVDDISWPYHAFYVTITLRDCLHGGAPIVGATVWFRGQSYVTNENGKIDLDAVGAYPSDSILVQHEDFPDTAFEFQITEDTDYVFDVIGVLEEAETLSVSPSVAGIEWELPEPQNSVAEAFSPVPKVDATEWVDARYEVAVLVQAYETGQVIAGANVTFAGETKVTDGEGEVTFYQVKPFPTVDLYEVQIEEYPIAKIRVTGHEPERKITVAIQAGLETLPYPLAEEAEIKPRVDSILWVEV